MSNENSNKSRVTPRRVGLKVPELYAGKLACTVLRGRKLPGALIEIWSLYV